MTYDEQNNEKLRLARTAVQNTTTSLDSLTDMIRQLTYAADAAGEPDKMSTREDYLLRIAFQALQHMADQTRLDLDKISRNLYEYQTPTGPTSREIELGYQRQIEELKTRFNLLVKQDGSLLDDEIEQVRAGNKINAIKLVRQRSMLGLKEAKDLVETWCDKNIRNYRRGDKVPFLAKGGAGGPEEVTIRSFFHYGDKGSNFEIKEVEDKNGILISLPDGGDVIVPKRVGLGEVMIQKY